MAAENRRHWQRVQPGDLWCVADHPGFGGLPGEIQRRRALARRSGSVGERQAQLPASFRREQAAGEHCGRRRWLKGSRRLNLRNLIDCSGRQEYVDTVRMQFGFTLRGARKRLPDWLAGLGRPVAVN